MLEEQFQILMPKAGQQVLSVPAGALASLVSLAPALDAPRAIIAENASLPSIMKRTASGGGLAAGCNTAKLAGSRT